MELGKKIMKIRKDNKLTQEDFAYKYYVTRQTVSNWENSKSYPDLDTLVKISDDFDISLDVLLKEDKKVIENISKSQKDSKKYKKILIAISVIIILFICIFGLYAINYYSSKNRLENKFETALKDNGFNKNNSGYYSYKYNNITEYGVPNQKMPSILEFDLDFHVKNLYCDIKNEDGTYIEGIWLGYDNYDFTLYNSDEIVIGSSSSLKKDKNNINKLSKQLRMSEKELKELIDKGNELYDSFYEHE